MQTYEGGEEVAWIGAPDSEEPAPTSRSRRTPRAATPADDGHDDETATRRRHGRRQHGRGAGDERRGAGDRARDGDRSAERHRGLRADLGVVDDDDTPAATWVALALGAAGLVAGVAALVVALRRRPGAGPPGDTDG